MWKVVLPIDKKSRTFGKCFPNWEGPFKIEKVSSENAYALVNINDGLRVASINRKYWKKYELAIYEVKIRQ